MVIISLKLQQELCGHSVRVRRKAKLGLVKRRQGVVMKAEAKAIYMYTC